MHMVHITGWRAGLYKINLTKTVRAHLGGGLAEAKGCTDQVLDGIEVTLCVPNAETARVLARELDVLGAEVTLELETLLPRSAHDAPRL